MPLPELDTKVGGMNVPVGPKDLSSPGTPPQAPNNIPEAAPNPLRGPDSSQPATGQQPISQSSGQAVASPNRPPEALTKQQAEVDKLFEDLHPKSEKDLQKEVDDLFASHDATDPNLPVVDEKRPGESYIQSKVRQLPEQLQFLWAQMKAHMQTNPQDIRAQFEDSYGAKNIRVEKDGSLSFRPTEDSRFRKVDQGLWGKAVDYTLYNSLRAIPLIANGVTQGALDAGSVITAPETGGASLTGLAASGAAGGAVEGVTRQALKQLVSKSSVQGDPLDPVMSAGFNAVGGPVAGALTSGARYAVSKVGELLKPATAFGVEALERAAGPVTTQLAMARQGFKEALSEIFPHADFEKPVEFTDSMKSLFNAAEKRLGTTIGSIENEVISLAGDKKVPMDKTLTTLKDSLTKNGYALDSEGKMALANESKLNLVPTEVKSALDKLSNHYNLLSGDASIGGTAADDMFSYTKQLGLASKFDVNASEQQKQAINLYKSAWKASAADRDTFIKSIYDGAPGEHAATWAKEYEKYSDQIGSARDFGKLLQDEGARQNFLSSLMSGSKVDRDNLLNGAKSMLQEDHPEAWNGLQGQLLNHVIESSMVKNGVVNGPKFLDYLNKNKSITDTLFDNNADLNIFKQLALQTPRIEAAGELNAGQAAMLKHATGGFFKYAADAVQAVKNTMKFLGNSKVQIGYLNGVDGFDDIIAKAEGPQIRQRLIDGRGLMEGLTSKMRLINMPSQLEKGTDATIKRFAPAIGIPAAGYLNRTQDSTQDFSGTNSTNQ